MEPLVVITILFLIYIAFWASTFIMLKKYIDKKVDDAKGWAMLAYSEFQKRFK